MTDSSQNDADLELLRTLIVDRIPFNRLLGLEVELHPDDAGHLARVYLPMRDDLVGNPIQNILHGGVIASTLDFTGGMAAFMGLLERIRDLPRERKLASLARLGTIDLRIDYLRPGRGRRFTATGSILRTGNKVAVTRMELHNDENVLIATGTGTYIVG